MLSRLYQAWHSLSASAHVLVVQYSTSVCCLTDINGQVDGASRWCSKIPAMIMC